MLNNNQIEKLTQLVEKNPRMSGKQLIEILKTQYCMDTRNSVRKAANAIHKINPKKAANKENHVIRTEKDSIRGEKYR